MKKREIRIVGDFAFITLTQGFESIIDVEDIPKIGDRNWCVVKHRNTYYATGLGIRLHRAIMNLTDPKILCDHIDGDGLNNRKSNLRSCTQAQNLCNRKGGKNSTSKYTGIWKVRGKWRAEISINGKKKNIGTFITEIEAARAYDEWAKKIYGEFARPNFQ